MSRAKTITLDYRDFLQGPYQIQVPEGYKRIQLNAFSLEKNDEIMMTDWLNSLKEFIKYDQYANEINRILTYPPYNPTENGDPHDFFDQYLLFYHYLMKDGNKYEMVFPPQGMGASIKQWTILPFFILINEANPVPEDVYLSLLEKIRKIVTTAMNNITIFIQFLEGINNFGLYRLKQFPIKGFIPIGANYLSTSELDTINENAKELYEEAVQRATKFRSNNTFIPTLSEMSLDLHLIIFVGNAMERELIPNIRRFTLPKKINRLPQSSPLYDRYVKNCPETVYLNIQGINSWRNTAAVYNGEPFILGMQGNTFELSSPTLIISMNDIEGGYFNASTALIQFTFI